MSLHLTYDGFQIISPRPGPDGRTGRGGVRIYCCECTASETIYANSAAAAQVGQLTTKKFRERGWEIGKNRKRDVCPACQAARRKAAPQTKLVVVQTPVETPMQNTITPLKAEPPREMTREDRRVILLKLNETYVDERTGYDKGWSDKRVAEDLGVPQAWVAKLRDENFGPENSNEEARQAVAQFDTLMVEHTKIAKDVASLTQVFATQQRRIEDLQKIINRIQKQF